MNIAEGSIRNKIVTIVMSILITIGGIISFRGLGRLEDPEFTIKEAKVYTRYEGATAAEVAEEVSDPIEIAIQKLGQLKEVRSKSEPGLSTISVEIKDKYDKSTLPQVWDELRRKVEEAQRSLPPGAGESVVYDDFGDVYGVFYAVYGNGFSKRELYEHAKLLRRELLLCDDVADVNIFADVKEVVYVEISRARLSQLGLSPQTIHQTLTGQNLVVASGKVRVGTQYIRVQPTGEFQSVEDIGDLLIIQDDASTSKLYLKDIATITRGYEEPPTKLMQYNGMPSVGIGISTIDGGNVAIMGASVSARLTELELQTPIGMEIGVVSHQADSVDIAISGFMISLYEAIAIVVGVLIVAMGLRSSMLIGIVLILTVLATFMVMQSQGVMLERISLGALIIALGMLVDNAIVVVEGTMINIQRGMDRVQAAVKIVQQTTWPLFGATIIAILAFAAIGTSKDSTGEFCRSLFQVILYSLMLSWILAITVTPLLGSMAFKPSADSDQDAPVKDPYSGVLFRTYKVILVSCMKARWATVAALVVLLLSAIVGFGHVKKSFFPDSTRPQFLVHYWLPQGVHISKTEEDLHVAAKAILNDLSVSDEITNVTSVIGGGALRFLLTYTPEEDNTAYGLMLVDVKDYKKIKKEIIPAVNEYFANNFPDSQSFCRAFMLGPGDPQKIHLRLRGPDPSVLRSLAAKVEDVMIEEPQAVDVINDWRQLVPLIRPQIAESQARNAGITRSDVANALQVSLTGLSVGTYREDDELLDIIVRSPENERSNVDNINDIQIWSPAAQQSIPIRQVVLGTETIAENSIIKRLDRLPTITVKCDPATGVMAEPIRQKILTSLNELKSSGEFVLPVGYSMEWGGEYEDSGDAQSALAANLPMFFVVMVLVVIVLFNSIRLPTVIFLTVPLSIIGVTAGLLLTDQPFGFMALLGFLSLVGMMIKNAIVLIDEILAQSKQDKDHAVAIVDAGMSRLRPVSMAAMTTVLGMLPLLADAFFVSMAVTIMFGLTFATILTLVVVPVIYSIVFKIPLDELSTS
jgi:multidrug efflux pump subunit AcrB